MVVLAFILLGSRDQIGKRVKVGRRDNGQVVGIIVGVLPRNGVGILGVEIPVNLGPDEQRTNGNRVIRGRGRLVLQRFDFPVFVEQEHAKVSGVRFALQFFHQLNDGLRDGTHLAIELNGVAAQNLGNAAQIIVSAGRHTGVAAGIGRCVDVRGNNHFRTIGGGQQRGPRRFQGNGGGCGKTVSGSVRFTQALERDLLDLAEIFRASDIRDCRNCGGGRALTN